MDEKPKRILNSALELFAAKGFHGTATSAIAKKANVSNGTLFHYFSSKNDLVQGLYQLVKTEQIEAISAGLDPDGNPKEQFKLIWRQAIEWAINNKDKYEFLHQYKFSPYQRKPKKNVEEFRGKFSELVEKSVQKHKIRLMPYEYVYEMTNAHVYGMVEYLRDNPVKFRTPEFMRQSFEWFWKGLEP